MLIKVKSLLRKIAIILNKMSDISRTKTLLRQEYESRRSDLGLTIRTQKSRVITQKLREDFDWKRAVWVCAYLWFKNEVQTDEIIKSAWKCGKKVCVPLCGKTEQDKIILYQILSFSELSPGKFGIREPSLDVQHDTSRIIDPHTIDVFLVPGLAFDSSGNRLGWGGGYYDWILSRAPQATKIALAFSCQLDSRLPAQIHDIAMDKIITD